MTKQNLQTIGIIAIYTMAIAYVILCTFQTIENLSTLGASMLAFKPSFSVDSLVSKSRKYGESSHNRNFCGLHTPIYRVINFAQDFILQRRISRDFMMNTSRGQAKWIVQHNDALSINMAFGFSAVKIGARTIFAVDENTRTIYHIDSKGRLAVTDYYQDYDMTDVNAQVAEVLEVIAQHYNADKYKAIDADNARQQWFCYAADNLGVVNDTWSRATIQMWHKVDSKKSIKWTKYWGRETPSGAKEYKTTNGEHPSAYLVNIGGTEYWIPHSICSSTTALHGGRQLRHDGAGRFLGFHMHLQTIDLPLWWLEKTVGVDWADKVEPIGRSEFFKSRKRKRRWRR